MDENSSGSSNGKNKAVCATPGNTTRATIEGASSAHSSTEKTAAAAAAAAAVKGSSH
jgi:hypothetical protein